MAIKLLQIISVFLLVVSTSTAQDFTKDYKAIGARMQKSDQFHSKTIVKVFNGGKNPIVIRTSEIKRKGDYVMVKSEGMLAMYTPKYMVAVVEGNNLITYGKGLEGASEKALNSTMLLNDSVLALFDSVSYTPLSLGRKKYTLFLSTGMFSQVSIVMSKELEYQSMNYVYNSKVYSNQSHVEVEFATWNESPKINDSVFSIEKIMSKKKGVWIPSEKYKGFQIIDNSAEN